MLLFLLAVSAALAVSFFCSLAEGALLSVRATRVEALARTGNPSAILLRRYKAQPDRPIAAILVLNTIAHTGGATIATDQFVRTFPDASPAWFAAVFVVAVLLLTEILPKTLGVEHADRLAVPVARAIRVCIAVLSPLLVLTQHFSRLFSSGRVVHTASLEEIRVLAATGHSQGAFGALTAGIIENATRLRETKARDVMVPRSRVSYLSGKASAEANLDLVQRGGHSRYPYTPTGELEHVAGFILTKELLFALREQPVPDWEGLLVPLLVVPETATLNHVLRAFQREQRHMAIVVDEYGTMQGIVTLEDVLEEIVGEIEDELDTEETHILERADGSLLCRGMTEVRKVFGKLGLADVETSSQTLSGFLAELLGSVPQAGAHADFRGFRFTVTKANNRRAERVKIARLPKDEPAAPAPA
jgi:putative hemolysin